MTTEVFALVSLALAGIWCALVSIVCCAKARRANERAEHFKRLVLKLQKDKELLREQVDADIQRIQSADGSKALRQARADNRILTEELDEAERSLKATKAELERLYDEFASTKAEREAGANSFSKLWQNMMDTLAENKALTRNAEALKATIKMQKAELLDVRTALEEAQEALQDRQTALDMISAEAREDAT